MARRYSLPGIAVHFVVAADLGDGTWPLRQIWPVWLCLQVLGAASDGVSADL
jgi:hypothetical protein